MSATRLTLTFTVEHGEEGCGEPWDTGSLAAAALIMLSERFGDDELRVETISASEIDGKP